MKVITLVPVLFLLSGCAGYEYRQPSPEQTAANMALMQTGLQLMQQGQPQYTQPAPTYYQQPAPAANYYGSLRSQSVNGGLRYCSYTNNVIKTVNVGSPCPSSAN